MLLISPALAFLDLTLRNLAFLLRSRLGPICILTTSPSFFALLLLLPLLFTNCSFGISLAVTVTSLILEALSSTLDASLAVTVTSLLLEALSSGQLIAFSSSDEILAKLHSSGSFSAPFPTSFTKAVSPSGLALDVTLAGTTLFVLCS